MSASLPRIALSIGDPAGIGPEIALKAVLDPRVTALCRPILVGEAAVLARHAALCGMAFAAESGGVVVDGQRIPLEEVAAGGADVPMGAVSREAGAATVAYARHAIAMGRDGRVDAVVACPQTEASVNATGLKFDGYPGFLADECGVPRDRVFLMLVSDRFRIVNLTLHVSLREAIDQIDEPRILAAARSADAALRKMGVARPRIGVMGINPHAGEDGLFGREDEDIVRPAVARARAEGLDIHGPFGADVLLAKGEYDVYLAMYHDQAHIPIKLLSFGASSGMPIGTPVLFSSVPHGTAHDIAGKNRANPGAVLTTLQRLAAAASGKARD